MNRISVIVPVYNLEAYVSESIGSILRQTHADLEVIAVDDGSTDGSLAVLRQLAGTDARLHVLHQENGGVTRARLTGVRAATGEWIGFMDGDDRIEPEMYERLLQNALAYDADISHCGYQMVFPSHVDYYYNTGRLIEQDNLSGQKDLIEGRFVEPSLINKLYRRELLEGYLNSDEGNDSVRNYEDLLMNFYLFRRARRSVYEDICPYHYVLRKGSAATSGVNEYKLRDPLIVARTIREETKTDPVLLHAANERLAGALTALATMALDDQPELIRRYRTDARKELRELCPAILKGQYSAKRKLITAWAALLPGFYGFAHRFYGRLTGHDRKYEVR
ncbi:MAG: glycosyltransferase [Clostridia bacterium]|nr:glycosyltransferase [Clostridia bacterium]